MSFPLSYVPPPEPFKIYLDVCWLETERCLLGHYPGHHYLERRGQAHQLSFRSPDSLPTMEIRISRGSAFHEKIKSNSKGKLTVY